MVNGKLSKLQLEGVAYACQKHCELLPDGTRAGFMIGDGAGVGKGRQISGIILDNYSRGRKRHLWISSSSDLHRDAERDLRDLGCYLKVINGCQELDREGKRAFGLPKDFREGVLFLTCNRVSALDPAFQSRVTCALRYKQGRQPQTPFP